MVALRKKIKNMQFTFVVPGDIRIIFYLSFNLRDHVENLPVERRYHFNTNVRNVLTLVTRIA